MPLPADQATRKKLRFAVIAVCLFLGLAETGMQVVRMLHPTAFRINVGIVDAYTLPADPRLLFAMQPGRSVMKGVDVQINSLGWRGPLPASPKPPETYRMMVFGDSSVFGDGVVEERSFANETGRMLEEREHRDVEVINTAVPGYSSTQCRIVFEDHVDRLEADAVVLAPLWSDIIVRPWNDADLLRRLSSDGYRFDGMLRRSMRYSAAFCWLEARYERSRGLPDDRMIAFHRMVNPDVKPEDTGDPRVSVSQHRENLRAMCTHATRQGIDVVLVLLHSDPALFFWPEARLDGYRRNYEEAARDFGVPLVDVPRVFPEEPDVLAGLFQDGIHPTAEGHVLIAREVSEAIRTAPRFSELHGD